LLDENLPPGAVAMLVEAGLDSYHVRDRGLLGASDAALFERAYQEDRVVVTSNVTDFVKLARAREVHAGLVLIEQVGHRRPELIELLRAVAGALTAHGPMLNEVLWVRANGALAFETMPRR
jgi:predicted nuclease of predicted toxin-antitoxin system